MSDSTFSTPFGMALKKLLLDRDMNVTHVAEEMFMSGPNLYYYMKGQRYIPDDIVERLAHVLKLTEEEAKDLEEMRIKTQPFVKIDLSNCRGIQKQAACAMKRAIENNELTDLQCLQILDMLENKTPYNIDLELIDEIEAMKNPKKAKKKREVITLCGSTKFKDDFIRVQEELTLQGKIVISVGLFGHADNKFGDIITDKVKKDLDDIHKRKIDLSDSIYVINKGGYIGSSTKSEIAYAKKEGKNIYYMEKDG